MEKEISSGAMLGIVLIALAAVIGLGFGVFAIAKGTANEGIVGVQDSLNSVGESGFSDYNQKTVTGATVKSALTNYSGKSYAILVNTQGLNNGQITQSAHTSVITMKGQNKDAASGVGFVNFNAILSSDGTKDNMLGEAAEKGLKITTGTSITADEPTADKIAFKSGTYLTEAGFAMEDGNIIFDTVTSSVNTSGDCLNIPDNTKFKANLIKDSAGTIKGIVFEQQPKA